MALRDIAPGKPGIPPRWTSSDKDGVGTSASPQSRVWFTLSHGIVNEVYYPRIDQANTRDMELLVADGQSYFSEEKRDTTHKISMLEHGIPAYSLSNTCREGRYRLSKIVVTDPERDVLLQKIQFEPLKGQLEDYGLYVLLAPHIGNRGYGNDGWVGDYKGIPMLFARRDNTTLALACSSPFSGMSCGYVGTSDGWQDINAHKRMTWYYPSALDGNIALTGQIDTKASGGECVVVLAFGRTPAEAGQQARNSLLRDFDEITESYVDQWKKAHANSLDLGKVDANGVNLFRLSTTVLKTHEEKSYPGAIIASLSIPWGFSKGDDDIGGYHLVWPRDLAEAALGLLASGDVEHARETLLYLMSTQEADGHWLQNMWLDGSPYWGGVQMDEVAFPILIADALHRMNALRGVNIWQMIRSAAGFIVRNGPVTQQDRWEEEGGYSPFTLAVEIAGLLAAADFSDRESRPAVAKYLRETADAWNDAIEHWTYATDTELSRRVGVEGYYVRIAPADVSDFALETPALVTIKNRPPARSLAPRDHIVSVDALALVRFGLRSAEDPRILNTVKVLDAVLKKETKTGPVWRRYNHDGYGEHQDGTPFDGTGIGRGWPLLTGERAHYELARGNYEEAERLLHVIQRQTSAGGLIPEQIWDGPETPGRGLVNGHPAGSAMPLVWAHAEYIKLVRSLNERKVFDMPPQPVTRYQRNNTGSKLAIWRFNQKCRSIPQHRVLRIETLSPALVHWSSDKWQNMKNTKTTDTGLGIHHADLFTETLPPMSNVTFTFFWPEANRWEGADFQVTISKP